MSRENTFCRDGARERCMRREAAAYLARHEAEMAKAHSRDILTRAVAKVGYRAAVAAVTDAWLRGGVTTKAT